MDRFPKLSATTYRWGAICWTLGIVVACSLPPASLAAPSPALGLDKVAHFVLFAGLAGLWMRALCPPGATTAAALRHYGLRLALLGGLFAVGTEVYQHLLPIRRMADPYDALADGVGLLAGLLGYVAYVRRRNREAGGGD
jgi:VanZ family protein